MRKSVDHKARTAITLVAAAASSAIMFWMVTPSGSETSAPLVRSPSSIRPEPAMMATAPTLTDRLQREAATTSPTAASPGLSPADQGIVTRIHGLFATGDFVGALQTADEHYSADDTTPSLQDWIGQQLPVLLTSAGWSLLKFGDCETAMLYLKRSEGIRRTPETAKGLAICYYKTKNLIGSREQFQAYLEKAPEDLQMQLLYTDVLESEGQFNEAVRVLEEVEKRVAAGHGAGDQTGADPAGITARLATMRGKSRESHHQQTEFSPNFRILYRSTEHDGLIAGVMAVLENSLDEYIDQWGFAPPRAPVEVVLYEKSDFGSLAGGPGWAEGLFDGRMRIPVHPVSIQSADPSLLTPVLRHELVHALLALMSDMRRIPSWFDEGLAQRLSCSGGACGTFEFPPAPGKMLSAQVLMAPYVSLSAAMAGRAYRQSLYLMLALTRDFGNDVLRQMVRGITPTSTLTSDQLLEPAGISFAELHRRARDSWDKRLPLRDSAN